MTNRRAINKLASILFRHVEHYVITAKADANSRVVICTDMPEVIPTAGVTVMTPAEFMADSSLDTPLQMRIDVITTPTYPLDDLNTLATALLPGCGARMEPLGRETPSEIISAFSDNWHEAASIFDIKDADPAVVDLRYDVGQSPYRRTPKADEYQIPGYMGELSIYLPRNQAGDGNSAALQRSDRYFDYFDDHIWMRRMFYEMIPVAMYQMLCFGSCMVSRHPSGHIEEYCYAPMIAGTGAAETIMRCQMDTLGSAIAMRDTRPLGYVLAAASSSAITTMNWSGCPSVTDLTQYPAGLHGLDQKIVGLAAGWRPIGDLNNIDKVKLNQSPALLRRRLYRQHENDQLWQFIDTAFFDEVP